MFNIILTMLVILLMPFHSANASNENYDDVKIGNISNYKIESGKYSIDFHEGEDAPESWTFSGSINSDFNKQLKKVMQYLSLNKPNSAYDALSEACRQNKIQYEYSHIYSTSYSNETLYSTITSEKI